MHNFHFSSPSYVGVKGTGPNGWCRTGPSPGDWGFCQRACTANLGMADTLQTIELVAVNWEGCLK